MSKSNINKSNTNDSSTFDPSKETYQEYVARKLHELNTAYHSPVAKGEFPIIAQEPIPDAVDLQIITNGSPSVDGSFNNSFLGSVFNSLACAYFNTTIYGGRSHLDKPLPAFLMYANHFNETMPSSGALSIYYPGDSYQPGHIISCNDPSPVGVILSPQWLAEDDNYIWEKNYDDFKDYKAIKGWLIRDEPVKDHWDNDNRATLKMYRHYVCSEDKRGELARLVFINLMMSMSEVNSCRAGCYKGYLSLIEYVFRPELWSYDVYPFLVRHKDEYVPVNNWLKPCTEKSDILAEFNRFYECLSLFSERSRRTGRPFWAYCMSTAHKIYDSKVVKDVENSEGEKEENNESSALNDARLLRYLPAPTPGMLKFEAFSAVAFGAKGIIYYGYGRKTSQNNTISGKTPIDYNPDNGTIILTDVWKYCREVNAELKRFGRLMVEADCYLESFAHEGVIFAGQPMFGEYDSESGKVIDHIGCIIMISSSLEEDTSNLPEGAAARTAGVLVTSLKGTGDGVSKKYVIIVNHNAFISNRVNFSIDPSANGFILTDTPPTHFGKLDSVTPNTDFSVAPWFERVIPPGGWIVIEWN